MAGMTLELEDPGGEAATQCLRTERVARIPGPLAASVMTRLATTAEEHPPGTYWCLTRNSWPQPSARCSERSRKYARDSSYSWPYRNRAATSRA